MITAVILTAFADVAIFIGLVICTNYTLVIIQSNKKGYLENPELFRSLCLNMLIGLYLIIIGISSFQFVQQKIAIMNLNLIQQQNSNRDVN